MNKTKYGVQLLLLGKQQLYKQNKTHSKAI